jgi:hypothetical protein
MKAMENRQAEEYSQQLSRIPKNKFIHLMNLQKQCLNAGTEERLTIFGCFCYDDERGASTLR